jgi:hypothetical protein
LTVNWLLTRQLSPNQTANVGRGVSMMFSQPVYE